MTVSKTCVKVLFAVATIIFVLALIASILVLCSGMGIGEKTSSLLEGSMSHDGGDVVGGWATLFGLFGSMVTGFAAVLVLAVGVACFIGNIVIYAPALIARIVIRKPSKGKIIAYWVLMSVWLVLLIISCCIVGSVLFSMSVA